ncbi:DUF4040 domain-containing protein [Thiothrix litoralis]|jgi:uncharacterized MnhB-related membrane protein|uniref:DUF4040 domain-containing protein n=1 Tax=Thiothrix litoralis TaxID=2891210 RepID=A0ABX7WQ58_9GAMM|nr:hydrogenase subunit MbhD domain-containing protein [Thiothrix litoralis]QTR44533.1 DUF4040 domain-containing protein [Thiothrix litoralis]
MNMVLLAISVLLAVAMIGAAWVTIRAKKVATAMLAAGLVSLFASVMFLFLAAPDVAMTEAAIGSGLTTFLFFFVLGRVRGGSDD